jgi:hypothetical protein
MGRFPSRTLSSGLNFGFRPVKLCHTRDAGKNRRTKFLERDQNRGLAGKTPGYLEGDVAFNRKSRRIRRGPSAAAGVSVLFRVVLSRLPFDRDRGPTYSRSGPASW